MMVGCFIFGLERLDQALTMKGDKSPFTVRLPNFCHALTCILNRNTLFCWKIGTAWVAIEYKYPMG